MLKYSKFNNNGHNMDKTKKYIACKLESCAKVTKHKMKVKKEYIY